jgi:hypothetical protein
LLHRLIVIASDRLCFEADCPCRVGKILRQRAICSSLEKSEQVFYTGRVERFPDVPRPRCQEATQLYTVPLKLLPAGEEAWQALCGDCFRGVLNAEPTDEQLMKPVQHGRRSRRR